MRIKDLSNSAFSLLEILLATVILIIAVGGIFATLNTVRAPVINKENALTATVFGKQALESLRALVNAQSSANFYGICAGSCTTFDLQLGSHQVPVGSLPAGLSWPSSTMSAANGNNLSYTVSCADTGSTSACGSDVARRVDLNISW